MTFRRIFFREKKSVEKYFSTDFFLEIFFFEKSILKMKISIFRFFFRIFFNFFSNPQFQNRFSSWKINIFHPNFFFRTRYESIRSIAHVFSDFREFWPLGFKLLQKYSQKNGRCGSYYDLYNGGFINRYRGGQAKPSQWLFALTIF